MGLVVNPEQRVIGSLSEKSQVVFSLSCQNKEIPLPVLGFRYPVCCCKLVLFIIQTGSRITLVFNILWGKLRMTATALKRKYQTCCISHICKSHICISHICEFFFWQIFLFRENISFTNVRSCQLGGFHWLTEMLLQDGLERSSNSCHVNDILQWFGRLTAKNINQVVFALCCNWQK